MLLAFDADQPDEKGVRPGSKAAWAAHDAMVGLNISAMMVDQLKWYEEAFNDVADIAKGKGIPALREWPCATSSRG